jgi:glucosylceramidase
MNWKFTIFSLLSVLALTPLSSHAQKDASVWLTNADKSALFQLQTAPIAFTTSAATGNLTIDIDDKKTYQSIDGFGFALTGGSAQLIAHMDPDKRAALLRELFTTDDNNIGVSYLRLTVGASDMNDHVFSYDDLPDGQTDPNMEKFSIEPDRADVIPVLKEILALDPKIKILASPWSAPL